MRFFNIVIFCFSTFASLAQTKPGTSFYGKSKENASVCPGNMSALTDEDVSRMISEMLDRYGLQSRFILIPCPQIDNCQATLHNGRPYILYNAAFLNDVKRLNFSEEVLPASGKDWKTLTILAHEIGHHLNNHLSNPLPGATQIEMELEADATAGFIIYLMGGTLNQAQLAFNAVSENGSYTHPGKQKRMEAIAQGWKDAEKKYPKQVPSPGKGDTPVNPVISNDESNRVKDISGNTYKTVKIGNQTWIQSNLNVSKFRDGSTISQAKTVQEWNAAGEKGKPVWCYYDFDEKYASKYGKLYNWYAVNDPRILAPTGWHVPIEEEWQQLITYMGGRLSAVEKIKSKDRSWEKTGDVGTDESGFSGLPAGGCYDGVFNEMGMDGIWWSSSEKDDDLAFYVIVPSNNKSIVLVSDFFKDTGFSVRCIKD